MQWLLQPRLCLAHADRATVIIGAIGDFRPAVILACLDQIDLVTPTRTMLDCEQRTIALAQRRALRIAVPDAPEFWRPAINLRVILRHQPVRCDAHDAPRQICRVLRTVLTATLA